MRQMCEEENWCYKHKSPLPILGFIHPAVNGHKHNDGQVSNPSHKGLCLLMMRADVHR